MNLGDCIVNVHKMICGSRCAQFGFRPKKTYSVDILLNF
jgi:hypothetical protein